MATSITSRTLKDGKTRRHDVRYRKGGRGYSLERGGSFATLKEAQAREATVADWLARGMDPKVELARIANPAASLSISDVVTSYIRSRIDVGPGTRRNYHSLAKRTVAYFGDADLLKLEPSDCSNWITEMHAEGISAGTLKQYRGFLRNVLDHALPMDAHNPARHRSVKLPRHINRIVEPPSTDDFLRLLAALPNPADRPWRSAALMLEQTGMRHSEALALTEADIDRPGLRIRVRPEESKTGKPRWIPIPAWYMEILEPLPPTMSAWSLPNQMAYYCEKLGIDHIHPHLLRHRRATIWHQVGDGQGGLYATELAARLGHAKVSESLDTYSHVRPITEADPSRILQVLGKDAADVVTADEQTPDAWDLLLGQLADDGLGHAPLDAHLLHQAAGIQ